MTSLQRIFFYTAVSATYPFKNNVDNQLNITSERKDLVIWGTNLSSTVGVKYTRSQLAMVQIAPYHYSVIIGLILSDGWLIIGKTRSKNALLGFKQSTSKFQFF